MLVWQEAPCALLGLFSGCMSVSHHAKGDEMTYMMLYITISTHFLFWIVQYLARATLAVKAWY